jgi:hypothetical protein
LRVSIRQRPYQGGIDEGEDGYAGANPKRKHRYGSDRKARRFTELSKRVPHVGPDRFQRHPLPDFPTAFFEQRGISECPARRLFSSLPAHTFAHKLLGLFFEVFAHLFSEITVQFTAVENWR